MPLTRRYMQRRPAVQIDAIHIDAAPEELFHPLEVPSAGQEKELHGGIQVLWHRELLPGGAAAPAVRVERGLPPEAEPDHVAQPMIEGAVPLEGEPTASPPGAPGELPRDDAVELGGRLLHLPRSKEKAQPH